MSPTTSFLTGLIFVGTFGALAIAEPASDEQLPAFRCKITVSPRTENPNWWLPTLWVSESRDILIVNRDSLDDPNITMPYAVKMESCVGVDITLNMPESK